MSQAGAQPPPEPDGDALGGAGQSMGAGKNSGNRHKKMRAVTRCCNELQP